MSQYKTNNGKSNELCQLEKMFSRIQEQSTSYNVELILYLVEKTKDGPVQIMRAFDYFFRSTSQKLFIMKIHLIDALIRFIRKKELQYSFYCMSRATMTALCRNNYDLTREDIDAAHQLFILWESRKIHVKFLQMWQSLLEHPERDSYISFLTNQILFIPLPNENRELLVNEIESNFDSCAASLDGDKISIVADTNQDTNYIINWLKQRYNSNYTDNIYDPSHSKAIIRFQNEDWMPYDTFSFGSGFVTMNKNDIPPKFVVDGVTYYLHLKRRSRSCSRRRSFSRSSSSSNRNSFRSPYHSPTRRPSPLPFEYRESYRSSLDIDRRSFSRDRSRSRSSNILYRNSFKNDSPERRTSNSRRRSFSPRQSRSYNNRSNSRSRNYRLDHSNPNHSPR
ncbi:hypothetical protein EHI8A_145210 [Entamoeba histolytica HM-1:IMSS-B]|uniref:Uncharacterized protein n=6 Tax=Entamoeba histolytica TaxID=5759 RepID=C4LU34_ENTH1|nr:hypothetical protein EHI_068420 [Entamoeba histolytica HM-1:IMSS]EMD49481.1 Hypothetical protein EHI5A_064920 [Entamoeba histolytica KU27]EMH73685.1 hypothetical protein EHI8A_145210 [Entamoeba histolytica HM-1:IMSS-B]EMS14513.1 hypothetical protein KM1_209760 [Entamoeba histolytica HM-3:IMSS]ENY64473.1 hypothetical protein EHI7A_123860 [Entamoeba histolytica HM-1:IMSS-A]GAT92103.1 hypothetical protein CL6EHI_068420 [Entamoeba histolytica]|eukprot:XP_654155.1 hypothetical protein EHI_068420 [Entamoeba histolytica HM-1:IMSS]